MAETSAKVCLLWLSILLLNISCNSNSDKGDDLGSFFGGTSEIDIEKLHNDLTEEIIDSVGIKEFLKESDIPSGQHQAFMAFYKGRDFLPAWIDEDGMNKQGEELLEAIEDCGMHGLSTEDYKLAYLLHLKKKLESEAGDLKGYRKIEKEFTAAYLKYASHILRGRIDPKSYDDSWITNRRKRDLAVHLQEALDNNEIEKSLQELEPAYSEYQRLKEALAFYQEIIESQQKWSTFPKDLVIKPGDSSRFVPTIAQRLYSLGDLSKSIDGSQYNNDLIEAIIKFQERHGLDPDSTIGSNTIAMLNINPAERAEQIKLNLERLRWLPEKPEGRHIIVNIPEYKVYLYEGGDIKFEMKSIVGKAYESTTPVFNDTLEYITFSPTWTVPLSIARDEFLPHLKNDADYLSDRGFKLFENWSEDAEEIDPGKIKWKKVDPEDFEYKVVQNPGESNSLGRVKFMFPNKMDIYLHDTPGDHLFNRLDRDFSHGCIRVEKPIEFAEYLLQEHKIDRETLEEYISRDEPIELPLMNKVPIIIEYRTAWVDKDDILNFREDIYGHDKVQLGTLKEAIAEMD